MSKIVITALTIYPIKSCGALSVREFVLGEDGPFVKVGEHSVGDREWMIVSPSGEMFTQRKHPKMSLLGVSVTDEKFQLSVGSTQFEIPLGEVHSRRLEVEVWGTKIDAGICDVPELNHALSVFLDAECLLVHFDQKSDREAKKKGEGIGVQTRFTDSSPYLIFSEESVTDLNSRIGGGISVTGSPGPSSVIGPERFRGNILVKGDKAYGEDEWPTLKKDGAAGGGVVLENSKACGRCVVTTIDPKLGKTAGPQPLKALNQFRRRENNVFFGQYFITKSFGSVLKVGDHLQIGS